MNGSTKETERALLIEQVFDSWEEYQAYYEEALKIFHNGRRKNGLFKNIIKRNFEIEFKTALKAPRYHYPDDSDSIVLQVPSSGIKTRARGEKRMKLLDEHQHVIGTTQIYLRDQLAMRMKIMGVKVRVKKKVTKKKTQIRK